MTNSRKKKNKGGIESCTTKDSPELPMEWADPQTLFYSEIIASYEDECRNNSDLAVEKLVLLLSRLPPIRTIPQSGRSPIVELEESLSSLPQQCLLGRLPGVVLLRIIGLLPMTTMLSLACTCKTFNSIINEQQHNLKNVNRITVNFLDFREDRIIMIAVRRAQNDSFDQVERYLHCSEVEIDNKLDEALFKLHCSPEGVMWAANVLAALLVNAQVSVVDFLGEHGVLFEQAKSFLELCQGRRPFRVDKIAFGFTVKSLSSIAHCKFWTKLLKPKTVSFYSTVGGFHLSSPDYRWLLTQEVGRVVLHDPVNLNVSVIAHIINDWYRGRINFVPALEVNFHATVDVQLEIDLLMRKTPYEVDVIASDGFRVFVKRDGGSEVKEILKPFQEKRIIIEDQKKSPSLDIAQMSAPTSIPLKGNLSHQPMNWTE